jgi:hypothetical protein
MFDGPGFSARRVLSGPGNAYRDGGAFARFAAEAHLPAEERGPLAHSQQANGLGGMDFCLGNASPIVFDFQHERVTQLRESNFDPGCVRVADDVGEGLLENAEKRRVQVLV